MLFLIMPIEELRGLFIKGDVLDRDFGELKIDRELTQNFSLRYGSSPLPVRMAMGLFYTPEEWEKRREEILSKKLPGFPETRLEKISYSIKRFLEFY